MNSEQSTISYMEAIKYRGQVIDVVKKDNRLIYIVDSMMFTDVLTAFSYIDAPEGDL